MLNFITITAKFVKWAIWILVLVAVAGAMVTYSPNVLMACIGALLSLTVTLGVFGLLSVFFKDILAHNPNKPGKFALFVQVSLNHSVVINRGGRPTHVLRGDEPPVYSSALLGLWILYKSYVMNTTGYHVYFPFFTGPTVYDLPRYEVKEEEGKKVYYVIDEDNDRYRSNHVRTELTTWYFEFAGAEIQKIPFIIKGSVQIKITEGKEEDALYKTDSWNVLLDQALNSVIRGVVRKNMTLRMVLGSVDDDLWDEKAADTNSYGIVAELISRGLDAYVIDDGTPDGLKLSGLGIETPRVDIIDFEDELTPDERVLLRAAVLAKEAAKGEVLTGRARASVIEATGAAEAKVIAKKGAAIAKAQAKLLEVLKGNPELADPLLHSDALRAFAEKESGLLDAVLAGFIKKGGK